MQSRCRLLCYLLSLLFLILLTATLFYILFGMEPILPDNIALSVYPKLKNNDEDGTNVRINRNSRKFWINRTDTFLHAYRKSPRNYVHCSFDDPPMGDELCWFDLKKFPVCSRHNDYGYSTMQPCVFLALKNAIGWYPEMFNSSLDLPDIMPPDLRFRIITSENRNFVWVSCEGRSKADQENLGPLMYGPNLGFPGYYFPYRNIEGFMEPLVMIYFENPRPDTRLYVECKAWARNIREDRSMPFVSVVFDIAVE